MTLGTLLHLYHTHHLTGKPSADYYRRLFAQVMYPLHPLDAATVDRLVLLDWFLPLKATPGHANKALGALRAAYRWAITTGLLPGPDPTTCLRKCQERTRATTISHEEWARLVPHLEDCRLRPRVYFWALYLLGSRPGEVRTMETAALHLDQQPALWIKARTKNGRPHVVPLPDELVPLLRLVVRFNPAGARYVFFGASPDRPWERTSVQRMWEGLRQSAGLPHLWLNDLRRSTASDLLNQGESLGVVQGALNHRSLSQTAKYAYLATQPLAEALQRRCEKITTLAST